jgi:hypothetical protein
LRTRLGTLQERLQKLLDMQKRARLTPEGSRRLQQQIQGLQINIKMVRHQIEQQCSDIYLPAPPNLTTPPPPSIPYAKCRNWQRRLQTVRRRQATLARRQKRIEDNIERHNCPGIMPMI